MKIFSSQFVRFRLYEKLPLFSLQTTTYINARLCNTNSGLNMIKATPVEKIRNLEESDSKKHNHLITFVKNELQGGENITNIIKKLSSKSDNIENIGLILFENIAKLKTVTPEKQIELAEEVLDTLRSLKITISEKHYIELLYCYSLNKSFPNCGNFLSKLNKDGIQPSETLQQEMCNCLLKLHKYEELKKLVEILKSDGVEISNSVYRDYICSSAAAGEIAEALEEYDKLLEKDSSAVKDLQISLLRGLILHGDGNILREKLSDFTDSELKFSEQDNYILLESILESGHVHLIPDIVNVAGENDINNILSSLLNKLMKEREVDSIFKLLCNIYCIEKPLTMSQFEFSTSLYKTFVDYMVESQHSFPDILNKCKELRKIDECHYVLEYLLHKYLMKENILNSVKVIEALVECDATIEQNYFWPLFIQAHKRFGEEGIIQVVHLMFSAGLYPGSETLLKYVFPKLEPFYFFKYFKILIKKRPLNWDVYYYFLEEPFMKALTTRKINKDIVQLLKWTNAVDPFLVLKEMLSLGAEDQMRDFLKYLINVNMGGKSQQVAESLIAKPNLPQDIKKSIQKIMTLENKGRISGAELEKESLYECLEIIRYSEIHMKELEAKKMNVSGELFRLLKYYMKVGLYGQAIKIRDQMLNIIGPQIELSPTFLSCMCRLYEYEKKYEEALHYYRIAREKYPNFLFDVPKVTGLCVLLIKVRAFDELIDLLERMPTWWGNIRFIEHKMVGILKEVASLGDPEKTHAIFDMLMMKKVIAPTENTLQPFVETYIKMEDMDEAVKEVSRIIAKYQKIPSVMLLVWSLAMKREFDKMEDILQTVIDYSNNKERIVITSLRTIACLGDVKILNKYFQKYEIMEDDRRFLHVLPWEYFGGEIDVRMKAFETFILNAKYINTKYLFADFAVEHACYERNRTVAEKLMKFLKEETILNKYMNKLNNVIELTKAFGQDFPTGVRKKNVTVWWELLDD